LLFCRSHLNFPQEIKKKNTKQKKPKEKERKNEEMLLEERSEVSYKTIPGILLHENLISEKPKQNK
jgi:hypothetical protein